MIERNNTRSIQEAIRHRLFCRSKLYPASASFLGLCWLLSSVGRKRRGRANLQAHSTPYYVTV